MAPRSGVAGRDAEAPPVGDQHENGSDEQKGSVFFRSILGFQLITSDGILLYVEALKKPKFVLYSHIQTKLTICEGDDSGDVLIFPDMIKYRLDKQFTTK